MPKLDILIQVMKRAMGKEGCGIMNANRENYSIAYDLVI